MNNQVAEKIGICFLILFSTRTFGAMTAFRWFSPSFQRIIYVDFFVMLERKNPSKLEFILSFHRFQKLLLVLQRLFLSFQQPLRHCHL